MILYFCKVYTDAVTRSHIYICIYGVCNASAFCLRHWSLTEVM